VNPVHLGVGAVIAGLVIAAIVALELRMPPDAQRLAVKNDFADAKCRMEFDNGAVETFSVRKGAQHSKTYKAPQPGFINMRCQANGETIEAPGSFHLMSRALAEITLKADGTTEFRIVRDPADTGVLSR
jgi:hypothetical protein